MDDRSYGEIRRQFLEPEDDELEQPQGKRRSWRRWAIALAVVLLIVWLLPSIVVHTPLFNWALKSAASGLNGTVKVESASLGWFSPVSVRGVEVSGPDGRPIVSLPAVAGDRWLLGLLCNYKNLGSFRLDNPKASLVLRDDGSNIEDLLAKYLAAEESPAKTPKEKSSTNFRVALKVIDGEILVTDQVVGRSWQAKKVDLAFDMSEGPMSAEVSVDVIDAQRTGKLAVGMKTASDGAQQASFTANDIPLTMFRALAARLAPGTTLTGRLSSKLQATWGGKNAANSVEGDLSTEEFSLATPSLNGDVLRLDRFHAGCLAAWKADQVEITKSSVECDVGRLSLVSSMKLNEKDGCGPAAMACQRHELSGEVDLARLARLLPATIHLKKQVEVDSGALRLSLNSSPEQSGMKWSGRFDADNIAARSAGRPIVWQRPVSAAFEIRQTADGPVVDSLRCDSDFLKIHGAGTADQMEASLSFSLRQLSDQLGQFLDIGSMQLAGEGSGALRWNRTPQKSFDANASVHVANFQAASEKEGVWRENEINVQFVAKGQTDLTAATRVDAATLSVRTTEDQLMFSLLQPVENMKDGGIWPIRINGQGQLANWPKRLGLFFNTRGWEAKGAYAAEILGTASAKSVEVQSARMAVAPLIATFAEMNFNEQRIDLAMTGSWNREQRRLRIDPANLTCPTAELQANNFVLAMPEKGPMELLGTIRCRGDVARVRQFFADPKKPAAWNMAGQIGGTLQFQQTDGTIHGETTVDVSNLTVIDSSRQQFSEPQIRLVAAGDYDSQTAAVQLSKLELTSSALAARITGRMSPVSGRQNANFDGQLSYDLDRMSGLLRPYVGSGVRITGRGASDAYFRGPFALANCESAAGLKWDSADVYGFRLGPGEIHAAIANGTLRVNPLDLAASKGKLHLAPAVRLAPEPKELTLPKGNLAERIHIDSAMCDSTLKFIAPVLADVSKVNGTFSIDLDNCRIPLNDPAAGEMVGRLTIHNVEVGSGPLVRTFAVFLKNDAPAKLRQESAIPFKMTNRRIYHEKLELMFPELTIRTKGWVGFDKSLNITAEMPIPQKWLQGAPIAAEAMKGQSIKVPVMGTLSKPQLDQKTMQNLTRQFMRKAAGNLIEGELNKLLSPKK